MKARLATSAAVVVVALFASVIGGGTAAYASEDSTSKDAGNSQGKVIANEYIVTVADSADPSRVAASANAKPRHTFRSALNGFSARLNAGQLNALEHHKEVVAIEPNQEVSGGGYVTQNLGTAGQPWGIDRIDQRSRALSKTFTYWVSGGYGAGNGVRAYVIDSGLNASHWDFGGRARNMFDSFGGNGEDCHGHGTHVAGTIGGSSFGVAKKVLLRGVRVLDCTNNGTTAGTIAGVDWVKYNATTPAVANISIEAPTSPALDTAVANLARSGVFVAASAGNKGIDACNVSPARSSGAYTVAASDGNDNRVIATDWASNFGPCVDIYAPGYAIQSDYLNGGTAYLGGTSMAAPHVAGVAALLKSDYGDRDYVTIGSWITNAATTNVVGLNVSGTPNRLLYMRGW